MGVVLGLHWDNGKANGKANGNHYLGFRVLLLNIKPSINC